MKTENKWISLRKEWPEKAGKYEAKDCRFDFCEGTAEYDGWDWKKFEHPNPLKGPLISIQHFVTHWRPIND
jgi:hypothetical protein